VNYTLFYVFIGLSLLLPLDYSSADELKSIPAFQSRFSVGSGYVEDTLGQGHYLGHGAVSFLYRPLENTKDFEILGTISTQTPLREENSYIELPLSESEFVHISELYIRHQINDNFVYKLGMFPDEPDILTPQSWPFYSAMVGYSFFNQDEFLLTTRFRADKFSTYSQYNNSSVASSLTRYRSEIVLDHRGEILNKTLTSKLYSTYNYFNDKNNMLQSLSLGRLNYISEAPPYFEGSYSYYDITADFKYYILENFNTSVISKFFNNLKAQDANLGYIYGAEIEYIYADDTSLKFHIYDFFAQENSIPPTALSQLYYPGAKILNLGLTASHDFNKSYLLESSFTKQFISPHLDGNESTLYFEQNVSIPEILFLIKFIYKFSDLN
jgi:hypothetical protein